MPTRVTDDERSAIVAALESGETQRTVARRFGRSVGIIAKIGMTSGAGERSRENNGAAARRDYCQIERLTLLNAFFDHAAALLPSAQTPTQFQALAVALAVLIDKRRLEDGEATARTDVNDPGARDRIDRRLDEFAARRDARRAAG